MSFAATIQAANPEVALDPDIIAQIEFLLVILTQHLRAQAIDLMTQFTRSGRLTLKEFRAAAELIVPQGLRNPRVPLDIPWPRDYIQALFQSCYPVDDAVINAIISIYNNVIETIISGGIEVEPNTRQLYLVIHNSEDLSQLSRTLKWDVVGGGVMPFIHEQLYPPRRDWGVEEIPVEDLPIPED